MVETDNLSLVNDGWSIVDYPQVNYRLVHDGWCQLWLVMVG